MTQPHIKDEILHDLASRVNVAQFVSFGPGDPELRYAHLHDAPEPGLATLDEAVEPLLTRTIDGRVNVRSFEPKDPKSREFLYGLSDASEVVTEVRRLAAEGLYTIINETIDVDDGGVSGVVWGDVIEFAPGETPRCVEKPGIVASLPRQMGLDLLEIVYGFRPRLDFPPSDRVEFSVHPLRRGIRGERTIIWELEAETVPRGQARVHWPNKFSQMLGDKAFGLLVAHVAGLRVPRSVVFSRRLGRFAFGQPTGSGETWTRTCPAVQVPGRYTTTNDWVDPYQLMDEDDRVWRSSRREGRPPKAESTFARLLHKFVTRPATEEEAYIPSVLVQEGVRPGYSGALAQALTSQADDGTDAAPDREPPQLIIEGVHGSGERFMAEGQAPESLPGPVLGAVRRAFGHAHDMLGPVGFEWVFDDDLWVVQLHTGLGPSVGSVIGPGSPDRWVDFEVEDGLEALRTLLAEVDPETTGLNVIGQVGITSHFGQVLKEFTWRMI